MPNNSDEKEQTVSTNTGGYQSYHFPEHQVTVKARSQKEALSKLQKQLESEDK